MMVYPFIRKSCLVSIPLYGHFEAKDCPLMSLGYRKVKQMDVA